MRRTEAGDRINELKADAARLEGEARALNKVEHMSPGARIRREEAENLQARIEDLKPLRRLEAVSVFIVEKVKTTKKGETRRYEYWYTAWREGDKTRTVYLGGCKKLTEGEALEKARSMKAEALGV